MLTKAHTAHTAIMKVIRYMASFLLDVVSCASASVGSRRARSNTNMTIIRMHVDGAMKIHGLWEWNPMQQHSSASTPKKISKNNPTPKPATRVDTACASSIKHNSEVNSKKDANRLR